jgi:membrane-associated phospholipid phosphatase
MRPADAVSLAAFFYFVVMGWARRVNPKQQWQIVKLGLAGVALIAIPELLAGRFPATARALGDWLPNVVLLVVYWQAGRFFGAPNQRLQDWLDEFDRKRLGKLLDSWTRRGSRTWVGTYFELAYLLCYAVVPLGVGVLYLVHMRAAIDEYWLTVLPATYLCYIPMPFTQTLPPRLLHPAEAEALDGQKIRQVNLFILRHGSIHLNTLPSGHVAAAVSAALVLLRHTPAAGAVFLVMALSIAVGAVVGRYHYAADIVLGAIVPLAIAALVR